MDKEPIASLITPFHNTNLDYFRECVESVKRQTIGLKNIEWIIVVHNSEERYLKGVQEMTAGCESFKVYVLNNESRTASSPRNYALDRATGKYVFFLDSDDRLTPECIHDVTIKLEITRTKLAKFRAEKLPEDDDVQDNTVDVRVRYDQTQEIIRFKKGDPGLKEVFTIGNVTPWTQAIRRDVIEENHIRFDESLPIAEDVLFSIQAIQAAGEIICLPQTIGYIYFINHGSTMQQVGGLSPEMMVGLARCIRIPILAGIEAGFDMRNLFWYVSLFTSRVIMATPGVTAEHRKQIRDLLVDVFDKVEPLEPNPKFYTEEEAEKNMQFVRTVLLDGVDTTAMSDIRKSVLREILEENKYSDIGLKYAFSTIHTPAVYADRVPVTDYDFYEPMIRLTTRIGEANVFCSEPVVGYAMTSGTMGVVKTIPYTKSHLQEYVDKLIQVCGKRTGSTLLMLPMLPGDSKLADEAKYNDVLGAALESVKKAFSYNSHQSWSKEGAITSPHDLVFPCETFNPVYGRALFALLDPDVTQIVAPFTWPVLELFEYIEKNWKLLVSDIRNGTINSLTEMPDSIRDSLLNEIKPDPARADELEEIFTAGFDIPVAPRIWPKMERVVAAGTGDFVIYTKKLKRYIGDEVKQDNGFYAASEAVIGCAVGPGSDEYRLVTHRDFFEFRDLGEEEDAPFFTFEELVPDHEYEIYVTNHSGFYRYRLGDVIKVRRLEEGVPVFTYQRRFMQTCRLGDVELTPGDAYHVVESIEDKYDFNIGDFCMEADAEERNFIIYVQPSTTGNRGDLSAIPHRDEMSGYADRVLSDSSQAYATAGESDAPVGVRIEILEPETQLLYRDRKMYVRKCMPDQMKPVRILNNPSTGRFFRRLIMK